MRGIFLLIFILAFSCSSKKIVKNGDIPEEKQTVVKSIPAPIKTGPTQAPIIEGFLDKTSEYGLEGQKGTNLYAVDFNNDSYTDLVILPEHYSIPQFFQFDPKLEKFLKIGYEPFSEVTRASFLTFVDLDKDGLLDLVLGVLNQKTELTSYPLRFYKSSLSKKGEVQYQLIPNVVGPNLRPTASISFFDFDLDGHLDLYEGNWYEKKKGKAIPHYDQLFKGEKFKFLNATGFLEGESDYSRDLNSYVNARPTFGVSTCDLDQNGYPDILISNSSGFNNKLWMNIAHPTQKGNRFFKEMGEVTHFASDYDGRFSPRGGGNSFYSLCSDYNNDQIMDVIVGELTHSYDTEIRDRSAFLTGSSRKFPPKFLRTEYHSDDGKGSWDQGDRRGIMVDYDLDGLVDVLVENTGFPPSSRLILFRQEENHAYSDLAESLGINILNPSGIVTADFNKDGKMDIVTGQSKIRNTKIDSRIYLYLNNHPREKRRSFKLHLNGQKSNTLGIGSMVILKTNKREMRKWTQSVYGPLPSQNESGVHFGLGNDRALELEVRWPILIAQKNGQKKQLIKKYSLKKYRSKKHYELTVCENGKLLPGKRTCSK